MTKSNVLLFLTPKSMVAYIEYDSSLRQTLEKMRFHRYTSVPMIDNNGKYVGTITEGDILWFLIDKEKKGDIDYESIPVSSVPRRKDYTPVKSTATLVDVVEFAVQQNFIPVVDDLNNFIGIITRKSVINKIKNN